MYLLFIKEINFEDYMETVMAACTFVRWKSEDGSCYGSEIGDD